MEKDLKDFVAEVKEQTESVTDIGKKAIRSTPKYKRLRKKYNNLDDLIAEIYKRADTAGVYKKWIEEEWSHLRLRIAHSCRCETHRQYAFDLMKKLRNNHPAFYKRLRLKYNEKGLINLAMRVICLNPWSDTDTIKWLDEKQGIEREDGFYEKLEESEKEIIEACKREAEKVRPYASGGAGNYY